VRGNSTAMIWKDKRDVNMSTNMYHHHHHHHHHPAEGNFCDAHGNALKPAIIQDYNRHVGYVDKSDHIMNT
jgi:hypothetical protein